MRSARVAMLLNVLMVLNLVAGWAAAQSEADLVAPTSVRAVVANGRHNAFTALVRWKDEFWLAFREAEGHGYGEADLVVMRSADAQEWTEAMRLNVLPDDRDPQFLATPSRLFLYDPALRGSTLVSYVTFTDDGHAWSEPKSVYQPQFIFWKPVAHQDRFYATAHKKVESDDGGRAREVHLITSADGLQWEKVSTIRAGDWESETTIWFDPSERLTAFIRTKYSVPGHILESPPPYDTWHERPADVHLSGHSVQTFHGVTYLFSRTLDESGGNPGTMIYTYADGRLKPYCALPAGGDCSYPEAVEMGDEMLVSYYSSHEGSTNVYMARVPLTAAARDKYRRNE